MSLSVYLLPAFVFIAFLFAFIKKVNVYEGFVSGVKSAISLLLTIFPYICAVLIMSELFQASGASAWVITALKPLFDFFKIPSELTPLILLKPLSGSGSLAILSDIYTRFGVDSYLSLCASCLFGASETVFYISAIYLSGCKNKSCKSAIIISLLSYFLTCIFTCFICKFFA